MSGDAIIGLLVSSVIIISVVFTLGVGFGRSDMIDKTLRDCANTGKSVVNGITIKCEIVREGK